MRLLRCGPGGMEAINLDLVWRCEYLRPGDEVEPGEPAADDILTVWPLAGDDYSLTGADARAAWAAIVAAADGPAPRASDAGEWPEPEDPSVYSIHAPDDAPEPGRSIWESDDLDGLAIGAQELSRTRHAGRLEVRGDGLHWGYLAIDGPDVWRVVRTEHTVMRRRGGS